MCGEELASGALVELLGEYRLDPIAAFVVFPAGRRPSQKARVFSDYLERAIVSVNERENAARRFAATVACRFPSSVAGPVSPVSAERSP